MVFYSSNKFKLNKVFGFLLPKLPFLWQTVTFFKSGSSQTCRTHLQFMESNNLYVLEMYGMSINKEGTESMLIIRIVEGTTRARRIHSRQKKNIKKGTPGISKEFHSLIVDKSYQILTT